MKNLQDERNKIASVVDYLHNIIMISRYRLLHTTYISFLNITVKNHSQNHYILQPQFKHQTADD